MSRCYLIVGGPAHGENVVTREPVPSYVIAKPSVARYRDYETCEPCDVSYETITYVPDRISCHDDDGTCWTLHVLLSPDVAKLGPFAKTRMAFAAAIRKMPGVDVEQRSPLL